MNEVTAPTCFPDGIPDEDYFKSAAGLKRGYTHRQIRAINARKDLVLLCAQAGFGVNLIAEKARLDSKLVAALIAKESEKLTLNTKEFTAALKSMSARWLALANLKSDEAPFRDLVNGSSLALQRANDLTMVAGMGESLGEKNVYEAEKSGEGSALDEIHKLIARPRAKETSPPQMPVSLASA